MQQFNLSDIQALPNSEAAKNDDFLCPESVDFPPNDASVSIVVTITQDDVPENQETIYLQFTGPNFVNTLVVEINILDVSDDTVETLTQGSILEHY